MVRLQIFLYRQSRTHRAARKQVVPAAVAVPAVHQRLLNGAVRFLAQAVQRVEFRQYSNDRAAAAVSAAERGFDFSNRCFHSKIVISQNILNQSGRLEFLKCGFGVFPNPIGKIR